jgi:hypothetical protein
MITKVINGLRVYQVVTTDGRQFFCNIEQLNYVVTSECKEGYFKIYYFFNTRPRVVSKKNLRAFFEGVGLQQDFKY